jgi:hypothetical protein
LAEFKRDLEWVERLDVTLGPVPEISEPQPTPQNKDQKKPVNPEDDFLREMSLYVCFQMWGKLGVLVLEMGKRESSEFSPPEI